MDSLTVVGSVVAKEVRSALDRWGSRSFKDEDGMVRERNSIDKFENGKGEGRGRVER